MTRNIFREIHDPLYGTVKAFYEKKGFGFISVTDQHGNKLPDTEDVWFHVNSHRRVRESDRLGTVGWAFAHDRERRNPGRNQLVVFELAAGKNGKSQASPWTFEHEYRLALAKVTQIDYQIVDVHANRVWIGGFSTEANVVENRAGRLPERIPPGGRLERFPLSHREWEPVPDNETALSGLRQALHVNVD